MTPGRFFGAFLARCSTLARLDEFDRQRRRDFATFHDPDHKLLLYSKLTRFPFVNNVACYRAVCPCGDRSGCLTDMLLANFAGAAARRTGEHLG